MNSAAGIIQEVSGGVTGDEQDRRPEACAGRASTRGPHFSTKAVNRRKFLLAQALLPAWYLVLLVVFWPLVWAFYPRRRLKP